jgi:hypothetical protein
MVNVTLGCTTGKGQFSLSMEESTQGSCRTGSSMGRGPMFGRTAPKSPWSSTSTGSMAKPRIFI